MISGMHFNTEISEIRKIRITQQFYRSKLCGIGVFDHFKSIYSFKNRVNYSWQALWGTVISRKIANFRDRAIAIARDRAIASPTSDLLELRASSDLSGSAYINRIAL
jgi:hypothetical protein